MRFPRPDPDLQLAQIDLHTLIDPVPSPQPRSGDSQALDRADLEQGRPRVSHRIHDPVDVGASPAPATNCVQNRQAARRVLARFGIEIVRDRDGVAQLIALGIPKTGS